jgi:hypothetical protein
VAESRLGDWISPGVLASWVPRDEVEDAVEAAGKTAKRKMLALAFLAVTRQRGHQPLRTENHDTSTAA